MGSFVGVPARSLVFCLWLVAAALASVSGVGAQESASLVHCWTYREPITNPGGLLVDEANVYAVDAANRVIALDRKSGTVTWTSEPGGAIATPIRSVSSSLIFVSKTTSTNGRAGAAFIRAISKATGITNWVAPLSPASVYSLWVDEKTIYVLAKGGPIVALDPMSGAAKWSRDGSAFADKDPYFGIDWIARKTRAKAIEVVTLDSWKTIGRFEFGFVPKMIAAGAGGSLVAGDDRGNLESISVENLSKNWSYKAGGAISQLIVRGGNVIAASADNFIYSISISSGNVEWKRRMPGRVTSIVMLTDSKLGLTVVGEKTAYVLDVSDGRFAGRMSLEGEEEFAGYPLAGDGGFVAALTTNGLTAFSTGCPARKAADLPAA